MRVPLAYTVCIPSEDGTWRVHMLSQPNGPTLCALPVDKSDPQPDPGTSWTVETGQACGLCLRTLEAIEDEPDLALAYVTGSLPASDVPDLR